MNFYIVPLDVRDDGMGTIHRGPRYVRKGLGFDDSGFDCVWSLKDFGDIDYGVLITDREIPGIGADVFEFSGNMFQATSVKERNRLKGYLNTIGVEPAWIGGGVNPRESLHRLLGMTQALQEKKDAPERWMAREIFCGETGVVGAFDVKKFRADKFNEEKFLLEQESRLGGFRIIRHTDGALYYVVPQGTVLRDANGEVYFEAKSEKLVPVIQGGALPLSDSFTTGSNQTLTAYNANYVMNLGTINVNAAADNIRGGSATYAIGHDEGNTYANDHYSQLLCAAVANSIFIGVAVRCAAGAVDTEYAYAGDGTLYSQLLKRVAGVQTQLGSNGAVFAAGATYRLEATGTSIRPMKNGATADIGIQTDSAIASGYAGVASYSNAGTTQGDDWLADNLGKATKNTDSNPLGIHAGISRKVNIP